MDNKLTFNTPIEQLQSEILTCNDATQLQQVVDLFNLNIKRKDVLRTGKLSELQDKVAEQMEARIVDHADEFSNKDLLDYFKLIQDTIDKSGNIITQENIPAIQINQQNVNIQVGDTTLSSQSREKVMDRVRDVLAQLQKQPEIIDVQPSEIKDAEENLNEFRPNDQ